MNKVDVASRYSVMLLAFSIPFSTAIMNVLFAVTVLLIWLSGNWREKFNYAMKNPVVFWVLLLFAMYIAGMFYSDVSWHERFSVLCKYHKLLLVPLLMPVFMNQKTRDFTLKAFMLAMLIVTVISYLKFFQVITLARGFGAASVFKNHSTANLLMAIGAYLWLHQGVANKKHRYLALLAGGFMVIDVLFMSNGRVGYMIIFALIVLLGYQYYSWKGIIAALVLVAILLGVGVTQSANFKQRINSITHHSQRASNSSVNDRLYQAKISWDIVKQHPFFGVGTGGLKQAYYQTSPKHDVSDNMQSQYLQTGVELGFIGLILLLLMLFQQLRLSFYLDKPYAYIAAAVVLTQAVSFLTLASLMDTTESHFFALFFALCFAGLTREKTHAK